MKTVTGGMVALRGTPTASAAVEKIQFPSLAADAPNVPAGTPGTMWLADCPAVVGHYDAGNLLDYADSNHHNDSTFLVTSNIGPTKYNITVQ